MGSGRSLAEERSPFARLLGMRIVSIGDDKLVADLEVRPELGNRNDVLHGGALMAFADNVGGTAAFAVLPEGATTSTVESKTNFFRAVKIGDTVRAECTYLHRGRTTIVLQTKIFTPDGKLAALVTQTQLVMQGR